MKSTMQSGNLLFKRQENFQMNKQLDINMNKGIENINRLDTGSIFENCIIETQGLTVKYGSSIAVNNINLRIFKNSVTAFIGPSGCGKSTLLRCFNRMNDVIDNVHITGKVLLDGIDIYDKSVNVIELRRQVGMVFQKSNPFPKSIYENIAFGLRLAGIKKRELLDQYIEESLKKAALWDEVKDRLNANALGLSGGQQQRLCIARAIAIKPSVLLMDEPASALDPIATAKIEELILELKKDYTILIVTHNMQQAARISDYTAFLYLGELIEYNTTAQIFTTPAKRQTEEYITGRFG
jgi:phosphate transport system ATP-binding protein